LVDGLGNPGLALLPCLVLAALAVVAAHRATDVTSPLR